MLRISLIHDSRPAPTVKLEGKLLAPWIDEVRAACGRPVPARLDLSGVSYADASGARLLAELLAGGAEVVACSPFIQTLLHR